MQVEKKYEFNQIMPMVTGEPAGYRMDIEHISAYESYPAHCNLSCQQTSDAASTNI